MNVDEKVSQAFTLLHTHKLTVPSLVENKPSTDSIQMSRPRLHPNWKLLHNNEVGNEARILV